MWGWDPYVSVATRRANAKKQMDKLKKQGKNIQPIEIEGRTIAKKFWGKRWCDHFESLASYANRLPRGRTYVRNGSVCHLDIAEGKVEAIVSGSSLYEIKVKINSLPKEKLATIKRLCEKHVESLFDFLQGKVSDHVMETVSNQNEGLFPNPTEISYSCSCPDGVSMCKHIAAVLYGIGNRLDTRPELLFLLRGVDPAELVSMKLHLDAETSNNQLEEQELADIFGLDFEKANVSPINSTKAKKVEKNEITKVKKNKKILKRKIAPTFDVDYATGNNIVDLRSWHGLSVTEFAEKLFVSPATIKRWEINPNQLTLRAISKEALKEFIDVMNNTKI